MSSAAVETPDVRGVDMKLEIAYFGERDHGFRLNVISESGGR
jgi:hypothetical protein